MFLMELMEMILSELTPFYNSMLHTWKKVEPGPAKVTVTSSSVLCASNSVVQSDGAEPVRESERVIGGRKPRVESGYFSLEKPKPEQPLQEALSSLSSSSSSSRLRRAQVIERFEMQQSTDALEHMDTTENSSSSSQSTNQRTGRSERRLPAQKQDLSLDAGTGSVTDFSGRMAVYRRAKSLDRRVTESSMTPDLLNFKKGWMTKLYEDGLWKKHWFVLTDQSLRYYRDSIAEEAVDLDGEIDLSTCFDVTEFPVQRNYGFQIHNRLSPCLSVPDEHANAKTAPQTPEVSRPSHMWGQRSCDVTVDSASDHLSDRKLIHWEQEVAPENKKGVGVASGVPSVNKNSDVQVEIEERWHQVETTPLREEKQVPITGGSAPFSPGDKISAEFTEVFYQKN
ncbi:centrosome-associated protein CEP250 isoform X4 [Silurus meridionalis]|nr:centrosome-associated protein CEP250 isoform X4 [Silurus meridionalis]